MISGSMFGMVERSLKLCEDRATILASNIANTSTPNYKARDFDFNSAMKQASAHTSLKATNNQHLSANNSVGGQNIGYRVPMQVSLDENTVDDELERKNFISNSVKYQASLTFAQNEISTLIKAIRGE